MYLQKKEKKVFSTVVVQNILQPFQPIYLCIAKYNLLTLKVILVGKRLLHPFFFTLYLVISKILSPCLSNCLSLYVSNQNYSRNLLTCYEMFYKSSMVSSKQKCIAKT